MTSEAKALPPPLSTRRTIALTFSSCRAFRMRAAVESPPIRPGPADPSTIRPLRDDDGDLVALPLRAGPVAAERLEVVGHRDLLERLRLLVLAGEGDHPLAHLVAGGELVHQLRFEGDLRRVAAGGLQQLRHSLDEGGQRFRRRLARLGDAGEVGPPDVAEPLEVGLLRLGRHVVPEVGFDGRLVLADAEDVPGDAELVDALAVVGPVAAEALDQDHSIRIEEDFVGLRGEVVAAHVEGVARGDDLLARLAEVAEGGRGVLEDRHSGPAHLVEVQVDG